MGMKYTLKDVFRYCTESSDMQKISCEFKNYDSPSSFDKFVLSANSSENVYKLLGCARSELIRKS